MVDRGVSPLLVGRRHEIELLTDALSRAIAGEPALVLVGGEAGVGKTRLAAELARDAATSGARVLTGACVEGGGDGLPFAPVVDVLRTVVRETPPAELDALLGRARPEIGRLLPEVGAQTMPPGDGGSSAQLFELLLGVLVRLAEDRPVLLLIEDLHWADQSTLDFVAFLARALRDVRVLVVSSYRSDEMHRKHPLRSLLTTWERSRLVSRIELAPFTSDEVHEQLTAILGERPAAELARLVYERSEGNAFLVEEILGVVQGGADPDKLPGSLSDVLLSRVDQLSQPAQEVLRTASVAGRWVAEQLLAAVTDLPERDLYAALREAVERHLLVVDDEGRGYAFRHALTRDVVYTDMLPGERGALHLAYGEALSTNPALGGADASIAATLAHHWYAALDLPRALVTSIEASQVAASASAFAEAQHHLERAQEIWPRVPDAETRTGITLSDVLGLAGVAAYKAGQLDRALSLIERALSLLKVDAPATDRATQLERRAAVLRGLARDEEAIADLRLALEVLGDRGASVQRAVLLAALARASLGMAGPEGAVAMAQGALDAATTAGSSSCAADALVSLGASVAYYDDLELGLDQLRQALELSKDLQDQQIALRGYVNLSDVLEMASRHEEAATVAARGVALASETGFARSFGVFLVGNQMEPLMRLGRWEEAERLGSAALLDGPTGVFRSSILELLAQLAAYRGEYDTADGLVKAAETAGATGWQYSQPLALTAAEVLIGRGNLLGARAAVCWQLDNRDDRPDGRYLLPLVAAGYRAEAELAELARSRGVLDPDGAKVRARYDDVAVAIGGRTKAALANRAVIAAERARASADGDAAGLWASAAEAVTEAGDAHLQLYTQFRLALALLDAGDRGGAAANLQQVVAQGSRLQTRPLRDKAIDVAHRARLQVNEPPAAGDVAATLEQYGLTNREHVVLSHVAAGRSNAQIAGALYISPKTASVHVSNILAKLGVAGRVEAAALAYRLGVVPVETPS
jgi:DNA-binding CsgD family transcriptional regulator